LTNDGIARAAQALAPRVAQLFKIDRSTKDSRQAEYIIRCSMLDVETTFKANRRIWNIEPQNVEGWNRFAQSF